MQSRMHRYFTCRTSTMTYTDLLISFFYVSFDVLWRVFFMRFVQSCEGQVCVHNYREFFSSGIIG